jgi:hypothetical protein
MSATTLLAQAEQINPFKTEGFQAGINIFLTEKDIESTVDLEAAVDTFLDRVGPEINSISLVWPLYTEGHHSSTVFLGEDSLTPESLAAFGDLIKAAGLGLILHPIIDEESILLYGPGYWRGTIEPNDVDGWFREYTALMVEYAIVAEAVGVEAFIIAVELDSMEKYNRKWRELIRAVRGVYSGQISYASNLVISERFPWDATDFISVNVFYALDLPADASVAEMAASMEDHHQALIIKATELGMDLVFAEVGTTAQLGSFQRSWIWDHEVEVDHAAQARYYEAICQVWRAELTGLYWWATTLYGPDVESSIDGGFDPLGKQAEVAMRDCFR